MAPKKGQSLLLGASILTLSTIIVKVIGAVFKIPLGNILDGSGMGYFSTAYNVFTMVYALSTAGLPAAISKMVAEHSVQGKYRDIQKLRSLSTKLFFWLGLCGCLLMLLFSKLYVDMAQNEQALLSVIAISPAIFFGCMMSAYRGYYEGMRNMIPTAKSQIVEVVAKLIFGLSLSYGTVLIGQAQFRSSGLVFGKAADTLAQANALIAPYASAAAIFGVTLSTFVGTAYLFWMYRKDGDAISEEELKYSPKPQETGTLLKKMIAIAIPISLGSIVMNVAQTIDTLTIINRLVYAFETFPEEMAKLFSDIIPAEHMTAKAQANFIYGSYSGYALSVFNLVPAFANIFGKSALPNVTACWAVNDREGTRINIESVIRMTSLIVLPASFGIFFLAQPILSLLFPSMVAEVTIASGVLSWQGISLIFLGLTVPLFAVLQGVGRTDLPPKIMLVGMIVKFVVNYVTIGIPAINVNGAAAGTASCYLSILILCFYYLKKLTKLPFKFGRLLLRPVLAGFGCGITAHYSYLLLSSFIDGRIKTLVAIGFAAVIYFVLVFLLRAITKDDVLMLPKGEKFAKLLAKYHLLG